MRLENHRSTSGTTCMASNTCLHSDLEQNNKCFHFLFSNNCSFIFHGLELLFPLKFRLTNIPHMVYFYAVHDLKPICYLCSCSKLHGKQLHPQPFVFPSPTKYMHYQKWQNNGWYCGGSGWCGVQEQNRYDRISDEEAGWRNETLSRKQIKT